MRHHPRLLLLHGFCAGRAHGGIRAPASGACSDRGNGTMHRSAAWIGSFLADVEHHVRPKEIRNAFGANLEAVRHLLVRERYEEHYAWLPSAWIDAISGGALSKATAARLCSCWRWHSRAPSLSFLLLVHK